MDNLDEYLDKYRSIKFYDKNRYELISILDILIETKDFDPSIDNSKSIIVASEFGRLDLVAYLLKDPRVDPSSMRNEAIFIASKNGWDNIVKILLEDSRVNPADYDNRALSSGIKYKNVVRLLLTDSRVEWRRFHFKMLKNIMREEIDSIREYVADRLKIFNELGPRINLNGNKFLLPIEVYNYIIYTSIKNELCDDKIGNVPSIKLVALAYILDIPYYSKAVDLIFCKKDTKYSLCNKIKIILLNML